MGYRLNRLDEPVFMAVSKPLLTEFGIHHRLESSVRLIIHGEHLSNIIKFLTFPQKPQSCPAKKLILFYKTTDVRIQKARYLFFCS